MPQIKEGLQQANQAMAAIQAGNYDAALQQLKAMPAVQNLLAEAQNQFPEVAALAGKAQQGLAAVQGGLEQSQQLNHGIPKCAEIPMLRALAQLQSIPAVQNLLAAAQQQFPQAAAALNQASALLPEVQEHLNQASVLMDAAIAGDLTQLPIAQGGNYRRPDCCHTAAVASEIVAAAVRSGRRSRRRRYC